MTVREILKVLRKDGWRTARIYFPDLPGCISFGNNLEEALRMAAEAERILIP